MNWSKFTLCAFALCLVTSCKNQKNESDNWFFDHESCQYVDETTSKPTLKVDGIKNGCSFYKGYAYVQTDNDLYGVIDDKGKWKTEAKYSNFIVYTDGVYDIPYDSNMIAVKLGDKWGFANHMGEIVIEPQYDIAYGFAHNSQYTLVNITNDAGQTCIGVIDRNGQYIIKPLPLHYGIEEYSTPIKADSEPKPIAIKGKWGYTSADGKIKIRPIYDEVGPFVNGLAPVRTGETWTYINANGDSAYSKRALSKAFPYDNTGKAAVLFDEHSKYLREAIVGEDEYGDFVISVDTIIDGFMACGFIGLTGSKASTPIENFQGFYHYCATSDTMLIFIIAYNDGVILFVPTKEQTEQWGTWSSVGKKEIIKGGQIENIDLEY